MLRPSHCTKFHIVHKWQIYVLKIIGGDLKRGGRKGVKPG